MIIKTELSCQGMKRKFESIKEDKYKQMKRSSQIDKLELWVMHRAVKDEVMGSMLGSNKQIVFFHI